MVSVGVTVKYILDGMVGFDNIIYHSTRLLKESCDIQLLFTPYFIDSEEHKSCKKLSRWYALWRVPVHFCLGELGYDVKTVPPPQWFCHYFIPWFCTWDCIVEVLQGMLYNKRLNWQSNNSIGNSGMNSTRLILTVAKNWLQCIKGWKLDDCKCVSTL